MLITSQPTPEKRRGAYYTPRLFADFLVRWAVRSALDRSLDPACGEAVFLEAVIARLREFGHEPARNQVVGFELDGRAALEAEQAAPEAVVSRANFFEQDPDDTLFDAIVGNPPYIRYHYFAGTVRVQALRRAEQEGVRLTQLTSSWAPFVVHAATFLRPQGRLAFVLPAELLSTDYAGSIRDFLRRRFARVDVVTFEERVFPGALVDAVLLLAEGQGPGTVHIHRLRNGDALPDFEPDSALPTIARKWTQALISPDAAEAIALVAPHTEVLGARATVDIGVVTGANRFFLLTDARTHELKLSHRDLRRVVARGHQLPGFALSLAEWRQQRRAGELVWLFAPRDDTGATGDYIRQGETDGVDESYKCSIRSPWWRLKVPNPPDLILSYMSNRAPRLVANDARVLTTNLLHNVRFATGTDEHCTAHLLALSWPNSATMLSCELAGRAYGGGVLKLETREAERVTVPVLSRHVAEELERRAPAIDALLREGAVEAAADLVDPVVLPTIEPDARAALRAAWLDLKARRKRRSSRPGEAGG